jgi:hypothetical protein
VGLLPLAGLLVLTLAIVVAVAWKQGQGGGTPATKSTQPEADVQATPGNGLPESAPLPDDAMVVPREVDDELRLFRVSSKRAAAPVRLTGAEEAHGPALSANRKTIIYLRGLDPSKVRVMAADGSGDRKLFRKPPPGCEDVVHLAWSPTDVDLLALVCKDTNGLSRIVLVHLDGTVDHPLRTGSNFADDPTFSPDGKKIAYWSSPAAGATSGTLFTIATTGRAKPQQLVDGLRDHDPVWSPKGDQVAFSRSTTGTIGLISAIYLVSTVRVESPTPLVSEPGDNNRPTWSPAGDKIAYVHTPAGTVTKDVWVIRVGLTLPPKSMGVSAPSMGTPVWDSR